MCQDAFLLCASISGAICASDSEECKRCSDRFENFRTFLKDFSQKLILNKYGNGIFFFLFISPFNGRRTPQVANTLPCIALVHDCWWGSIYCWASYNTFWQTGFNAPFLKTAINKYHKYHELSCETNMKFFIEIYNIMELYMWRCTWNFYQWVHWVLM